MRREIYRCDADRLPGFRLDDGWFHGLNFIRRAIQRRSADRRNIILLDARVRFLIKQRLRRLFVRLERGVAERLLSAT